MKTFQQWLEFRSIDIESIEPEMEAALKSQFEQSRSDSVSLLPPSAEVLVLPINCQWPQRSYRVPSGQ